MIRMIGLLSILFSLSSFAIEIPEGLTKILDGKSEVTLKGTSYDQYDLACEIKIKNDEKKFHIDGYERQRDGSIDYVNAFARYVMDRDVYEIWDYYDDSYGIESESRFYSPNGGSFDTRTYVHIDHENYKKIKSITIRLKKSNGLFFYTHYKLECVF